MRARTRTRSRSIPIHLKHFHDASHHACSWSARPTFYLVPVEALGSSPPPSTEYVGTDTCMVKTGLQIPLQLTTNMSHLIAHILTLDYTKWHADV